MLSFWGRMVRLRIKTQARADFGARARWDGSLSSSPYVRFRFQLRLPRLGYTETSEARDQRTPPPNSVPHRGWIWQFRQIITQSITHNQPIDENDLILVLIVLHEMCAPPKSKNTDHIRLDPFIHEKGVLISSGGEDGTFGGLLPGRS